MAFSDEALAKAIVAFIQRRTCEQMSRARLFMYQLLSFLGERHRGHGHHGIRDIDQSCH